MLTGKVALVTGASRGIGRAICKTLAGHGAKVVAVSQNQALLDSLVDEITASGGDAFAVVANVVEADEVGAAVDKALEKFGRIDILINNAGITRDGLLLRMKDGDWNDVIDTNLKGAFLFTRAVAKGMSKQRHGRIINITSVVGEMGNPGQANYCASKAGMIGLTKSNARELARRQVTVNAIAPGFIVTDMTDDLDDKTREALVSQIPLGRLGSADDVAASVVFLASDAASYITGQVIGINGGMHM